MNGDRVSGQCSMADAVAEGLVSSPTTPEEGHARCPHISIRPNGMLWVCACRCHADATYCPRCGEPGATDHTDQQCAERIIERVSRHDNHLVSSDALGVARKALGTDAGVEAPTRRQKPTRRTKEASSGACEHCGTPTSGGRFAMGHDAKLKSELRQAVNGAVNRGSHATEALAELIVRGWTKTAGRIEADPDVWERAQEIADHPEVDAWLARRVKERQP